MKFIYPAIFRKNTSGTYQGFFPDLDGCLSIGETLDDAIEKANEAAYDWITLELSENVDLPPVSEAEDLSLLPGDIVRNISVNIRFTDGWDE